MSGFIKIKAKELLLNNTLKLFFVSLLAFFLKLFCFSSVLLSSHFILVSNFFQSLILEYNSLLVHFIYSLFVVISYLLVFLFTSGIKTGENAIYFMQSKGSKAKIKYLFIFLKPSLSFKCLYLYFKIFNLKLLWFLFFYSPPVFCGILLLFLYLNANIYTAVFFTLILGISILLPVSHFYFNCAKIKYNYALYYLCTDFNLSVNEIINKSNNCSDGFIKDGVILKNSLFFWKLTCLFIFPIPYVISFVKLTNAKFITFTNGLRTALPQNLNSPIIYNE